jgi:serine/threonine protein kinase
VLQITDVVGDQYRLDEVIARGGATVVYRAHDLRLDKSVVVKVLNDDFAADSIHRERFVREARTAASLDDHPNIVKIINRGDEAGSPYIVTQFVSGPTLEQFMANLPAPGLMSAAEALLLLDQLASALDFANEKGFVHRDVKPANVMVVSSQAANPVAYLVDFGITKNLAATSGGTSYGTFFGTADYASPEQIAGGPDIDQRADVYSLACTAFQMLTGTAPFANSVGDAARIVAHLQQAVPSAMQLRPSLPAAVDAVFLRAMAKDRVHRHHTCGEFVRELRAMFPATEREYTRPSGAPLPPPVPTAPPTSPVSVKGRRRGLRTVLAIAAVIVAVVVAIDALGGASSGDDGGSTAVEETSSDGTIAALDPTDGEGSTSAAPVETTGSTVPTPTSTTVPPTTTAAESTTTAPQASTTVASSAPPLPPPPPTNPYGDPVGAAIADNLTPERAVVNALQLRAIPADMATPNSAMYFYDQWLRLIAPASGQPVVATDAGYTIVADRIVSIVSLEYGADGRIAAAMECAEICTPLVAGIDIDRSCLDGGQCTIFRTSGANAVAVRRATVNLRYPAIALLLELQAWKPIASVTDATGSVQFDAVTNYCSISFSRPPPAGSLSALTVTFADGTVESLTITY